MIDYDLTKIRGIAFDVDGVLSPSTIPLHVSGEPMRMVNIKDGYALQLAVKHGLQLAIITGAATTAVRVRFEGLGVQRIYQGAGMKLPVFLQWLKETGLNPEQVAYVGDDIPDLQVMAAAGLPIAPADAAPEVIAAARYVTPCDGGHGVARHVLEQVMKAQGMWLNVGGDDTRSFSW